jgi:large subunit ribosomal protein L30
MEQENKVEEVEQVKEQKPELAPKSTPKPKESKTPAQSSKLCAVRIRGVINVQKQIKDTMKMLNLHKKNCCVIYDNTPTMVGMLKKAKDYITWGEIDDSTIKQLFEKRGELYEGPEKDRTGKLDYASKYHNFAGKKYKKYFRLSPPRGGFERKGIKKAFSIGGALGNRGQKMKDLIKKMI